MANALSIVVENITFQSDGHDLHGRIYRPASEGQHPAIVICHGYPGDIKNMDLAEESAFHGIVALIFYYQGAWGSKGVYRIINLEPSTKDAVKYLKSLTYIDPKRVGLVSHSLGSIPVVKLLSRDKTIKTSALLAPLTDVSFWTFGDWLDINVPHFIESAKGKLEGISSNQIREDLNKIALSDNPINLVTQIKTPTLLVVGSEDDVVPAELCRLFYDKLQNTKKWQLIDGADHTFSEHRLPLIRIVLDWFKLTI